ncbi:hypothetical protein T4D_15194 [Trichinella pseudospiralis]|uniref:Uncharacterized protein n=1 Tax=Trichinella pseudospiralis TaxID=6337 RepID=A0A0V1FB98_TRIPS|nr:hypothetical protein T4D_15194 [Trichinella pseudospiralis]
MSLSGLLVIEKGFLQSFAERTAELLYLLVAIRQRSGCQSDGQWAPRLVGRTNVRQAFMSTMCNFIHARSKLTKAEHNDCFHATSMLQS